MLKLAHQLSIADLYRQQGLARLDALFLARLEQSAGALQARLMAARAAPEAIEAADESALIIELAPHLEEFLVELFGIADAAKALTQQHADLSVLYEVKRRFVQRQAARTISPEQAAAIGPQYLGHLPRCAGERNDVLDGECADCDGHRVLRLVQHQRRPAVDAGGNVAGRGNLRGNG